MAGPMPVEHFEGLLLASFRQAHADGECGFGMGPIRCPYCLYSRQYGPRAWKPSWHRPEDEVDSGAQPAHTGPAGPA